ncbi:HAMP domain-containing sensor histidine kinase [Phyllobacterium sp. 0TCS1.6C]|uniref:sensor histidine kinase n=1 Tax=unclassified Phyllobacterium TaxID=2638441 RepID=UPI0022641906|nr:MULTISPECIES: HAMP domain-containing sensor histidine kinase [unclassified Phyllobacterium]MCX8280612.1 HAMP domain-containing sensor histidine kinase [Phyllobacterium sp. 0TCS1.6C]MCX8296457.1 HAMP domain-containing sensor histidine kinase [Phyllobacterium sp. 0TCS1.6A]
MNRFRALMKMTAVRLSALYLLLFTVCALILVVYMTSLSVRLLTSQTETAINEEMESIGQSYQRGGIAGLVRSIDRRGRQPGAYLYLVADPAGRIVAGNVQSIEVGILQTDGGITRPFAYERYNEGNDPKVHTAIARVVALPNGIRVMVGRDLGEPEQVRLVVRRALGAALGIMGIGAFLIWFFVGRRALHRIDQVSVASQRIMGGDLSGRLPVSGSGDEFDRLSDNLNGMLARIQELNEGVRHVSDNIAHDLKTPLTRLRNRAEAALAGAKNTRDYRAAMEAMIGESDQLIRTFNAILMISRLESGYSSEEMQPLSLASIAEDVFELYEPVAEDAGIKLRLGGLDATPVKANRELLAQTVSNLVDNAIKYGRHGEVAGEIELSIARVQDHVELTVADNGPGIPPDQIERATERFVRLEESRSQPGSGLGLSLAKAVMKLHGGSLELEDNAPGLRAVLRFPVGGENE